MKFLLLGYWKTNDGPSNVNRAFVLNADKSMRYLTWKRFGRIERIIKCIFSNPIVVSGGITPTELRLVKLFKKKLIHIVHGYRKYENEINHLQLPTEIITSEAESLHLSRRILPVSEKYAVWVKNQMPAYASKISFLNNGVTIERRTKIAKKQYSIAVSGGNRSIKNNAIVCDAVANLINRGYDCKVHVFGRFYEGGDDFSKYPFVEVKGHLTKEEYYKELDSISLFVVNSELESFGLVVADAINCNCSLLMADNVGASSIFKLLDCDIIYNNHNVDEVSSKLLYLLQNDNSERLYQTLDLEEISEKKAFQNLKKIASEV